MFSKNKNVKSDKREAQAVPAKASPPSLLSPDLVVVGDMTSDGEIQIDGTIAGDIRSHSLLIGENAKITGEIIAETVTVHGTVIGQIKAHKVSLARTARVTGDILHDELSIENGAFLEGHCKRLAPQKAISQDAKNDRGAETSLDSSASDKGGKPAAESAGGGPLAAVPNKALATGH